MKFQGKTAFITGGGRGIGEVFAQALAAEGASVILADIDLSVGLTAAAAIQASGGRAMAVQCDVGDENSVASAVAKTIESFGGIDILINNAARHLTAYSQPITSLPIAQWREMLNVNVVGIVICAAACRPSMQARGGGVIVNISSNSSFMLDGPPIGLRCYGISKLAVRGLVVGLAHELAVDGIRVYGIAPGPVQTQAVRDDIPSELLDQFVKTKQLIKRRGEVADLVGALKFFCSDEASFITGETLLIGGGYPLRL